MIDPADAMSGASRDGEEEAGLHFICLGASLARQSCEQDPMLGNRHPDNGARATDSFSYVDDEGCPRLLAGLPQFVTVRGGAYFFMPGIKGLKLILED